MVVKVQLELLPSAFVVYSLSQFFPNYLELFFRPVSVKMDKEGNRMRCPFPRPIKVEAPHRENDSRGRNDGAWQAKESFPKLKLVRIPKSKQRQPRSNVNVSMKRNHKSNVLCYAMNYRFYFKHFLIHFIEFFVIVDRSTEMSNKFQHNHHYPLKPSTKWMQMT